ncbi:MAG: hypothetical protein ACI8UO_000372 [Verrucomicrobiales bacterium]|jgi:hypothetical protein
MNSEIDPDAELAKAYESWVNARASEPPPFEALAPPVGQRRRVLTFPKLLAGLAVAAALVFSFVIFSNRQPDPPAAAEPDIAMPWPTETDFLLTWSSDSGSDDYDFKNLTKP